MNNFGSYKDTTIFNTYEPDNNKNIVLIGGKNGAGKTTLFTAIRVCIYGCRSFGYQAINTFYIRHIYKLINNHAKLLLPAHAHIKIELMINNGIDADQYIINRSWVCEKASSVSEKLSIIKNKKALSPLEIEDFEKFVTQVIPPELFNLYFFDGEKIADFFLDDGGNHRLKNAFLTLCGYDTFEVMSKNFHRISSSLPQKNGVVEEYLLEKTAFSESVSLVTNLSLEMKELMRSIDKVDMHLSELDANYKKSGGITQKEWDNKFKKIRTEEMEREEKNAWLKKTANDILPFLILKEQLIDIQDQIYKEEQQEKVEYFLLQLQHEDTLKLFDQAFARNDLKISHEKLSNVIGYIKKEVASDYDNSSSIFNLSSDQKASALHTISQVLSFNEQEISKAIADIKHSIVRSQGIREELDACNIDAIHQYMEKRECLLNEKDNLIKERFLLDDELRIAEQEAMLAEKKYQKVRKEYEDALKKDSINDISMKAIIMLDKLQEQLYTSQIDKMIKIFRNELKYLIRKVNFIDDISIDDKFNIHIYRYETYTGKQLDSLIRSYGLDKLPLLLGQRAVDILKSLELADKTKSLRKAAIDMEPTQLPIEIDKDSLSNGEKQIFIMALYKSLVQLCNREVPFVIDTPFARIDSEHRRNIVNHFFCQLKGQVFILSTNEEVDQEHIALMKNKLLSTYTLKNDDNMLTTITKGNYFEEA